MAPYKTFEHFTGRRVSADTIIALMRDYQWIENVRETRWVETGNEA